MSQNKTYNTWLKQKVGEINPLNTYEVKITASDNTEVTLQLDLLWYILIQIKDTDTVKLDVVLALLQDDNFQKQFKQTQRLPAAKRLIAEFLLANYIFLVGLQRYLDFTALNDPIDFISYALLIKFSDEPDIAAVQQKRFMIVEMVLDSGFTLEAADGIIKSSADTILKVLTLDYIAARFQLVKRLLAVGFPLFGTDKESNAIVAVLLINNRADATCTSLIKQYRAQFAELKIPVAGDKNTSNLADYYYWVKEDMAAVSFIRETLGIDISG